MLSTLSALVDKKNFSLCLIFIRSMATAFFLIRRGIISQCFSSMKSNCRRILAHSSSIPCIISILNQLNSFTSLICSACVDLNVLLFGACPILGHHAIARCRYRRSVQSRSTLKVSAARTKPKRFVPLPAFINKRSPLTMIHFFFNQPSDELSSNIRSIAVRSVGICLNRISPTSLEKGLSKKLTVCQLIFDSIGHPQY